MNLPQTITAMGKDHLLLLIFDAIEVHGPQCSLNHIDVSRIEDFSQLFMYSPFIGDISGWNVSNATSFREMFMKSVFAGDISKWDTSNVLDMSQMFRQSSFSGDISRWDVGQATSVHGMFRDCPFEGDLSRWQFSPYAHPSSLVNFVAQASPKPRPLLRLPPDLPTRCFNLFSSLQAMHVWLAHQPMGRYHWDALLMMGPRTQEMAPWATAEMLGMVQAYFGLFPDAQLHPNPEHARALMHAWNNRGLANELIVPQGGFELVF